MSKTVSKAKKARREKNHVPTKSQFDELYFWLIAQGLQHHQVMDTIGMNVNGRKWHEIGEAARLLARSLPKRGKTE